MFRCALQILLQPCASLNPLNFAPRSRTPRFSVHPRLHTRTRFPSDSPQFYRGALFPRSRIGSRACSRVAIVHNSRPNCLPPQRERQEPVDILDHCCNGRRRRDCALVFVRSAVALANPRLETWHSRASHESRAPLISNIRSRCLSLKRRYSPSFRATSRILLKLIITSPPNNIGRHHSGDGAAADARVRQPCIRTGFHLHELVE